MKNDICRLIITIEDSGCGMSLDKVNVLLSVENDSTTNDVKLLENMNINLNMATKIVRLLGGQIIIKSEEGIGSEFIITIEQRIEKENNNIEEKQIREYSKSLFGKKSILIVTDKKDLLISITDVLKNII